MSMLTNAIKPAATDRATKRHDARMIVCKIPSCRVDATYSAFYADGYVARYCITHKRNAFDDGAYATAHHAAILVDDSVKIKPGKR